MPPKKPRKKCLNCGKECSRMIDKYCNNQCCSSYLYKHYINRWLDGKESGNVGIKCIHISGRIKQYLFKINNNKCELCGWCEINQFTKKIPLTVHHIDGNSLNTVLKNLQLLCPNCHSLTETYGNRGKGRPNRGKNKLN